MEGITVAEYGFWDPRVERMGKKELQKEAEKKIRYIVRYAYERSPFYRRRWKEAGIDPNDFRRTRDLAKLPFTSKEDLRRNGGIDFFAVPRREIVRLHMSSGTTGKPIVVGYTKQDLEVWSDLMARSLTCYGVTEEDVVQNAYGYGMFTGGLGFHYGAERIGATVIPTSTGLTKRQIEVMRDLKTTVLCSTPSYALYLGEKIEEMGLQPGKDISLRCGTLGAEPWSEGMRRRIEEKLGIDAYDHYGLTEMCGPGVGAECREKNGLHIWIDHFYIEMIDPETGELLGPGERGEIVLTSLTKEATPMIRFRTRDISILDEEPCNCGRSFPRILRIQGRSDDMLKVRGTIVFPRQVEEVLLRFPEVGDSWDMVIDREPRSLDTLTVRVEVKRGVDKALLKRRLEKEFRDTLLLRTKVELMDQNTLPRYEGKAKRVIDQRKL